MSFYLNSGHLWYITPMLAFLLCVPFIYAMRRCWGARSVEEGRGSLLPACFMIALNTFLCWGSFAISKFLWYRFVQVVVINMRECECMFALQKVIEQTLAFKIVR